MKLLVERINERNGILPMPSKIYVPVLFGLILGTVSPLFAQQPLESFSADVTYTANGETRIGKIYSDGHSVRRESEGIVPGQKNISFLRLDSGLTQNLIPVMSAYSEYPYGAPADAQFIRYLRDVEVKSESLGEERVDGQNCEKVLVTTSYKDHMYSSIEWRSLKLHRFVVRSQDREGQWSTEYRNIQLDTQTASLFQIPDGYMRIAYSQDWTAVFRQIQFAEDISDQIAIAKKAGLKVVGDDGKTSVAKNTAVVFVVEFKDPVTGNNILDSTMNVDSSSPSLPAPSLKSPENGIVLNHIPRKIELQWSPVPGAISYFVQVVILPVGSSETSYWSTDKGIEYMQQTTKDATFTFEIAGAQPGRWRVWAVDAHGTEGRKSAWSTFEFRQ